MKPKLIKLYASFVKQVTELGTCSRLQVGCVLTSVDGIHVFAFGYNGGYAGGPNNCISYEPGNCGCLHAEMNAVAKLQTTQPFVAFVSHTPCYACASLLINAGVTTVYALEAYRDSRGWAILSEKAQTKMIDKEVFLNASLG